MYKRHCVYLVLLLLMYLLILFSPSQAAETVSVVILPFEINATQDLNYLTKEIPEQMTEYLEKDGANVIDLGLAPEASWKSWIKNTDKIRDIGINANADYIIYGSLTWIDQQYSIDLRLLETYTTNPPKMLYLENNGIQNLRATVKKAATELGIILLKQEKIVEIAVEGNERIESDAILRAISSKPGDVLNEKKLSKDLKSIYAMGYFEDIRITKTDVPKGKKIIIHVKEKPTIRKIIFVDNIVFDNDELKESLTIKTGSILNIFHINKNIKIIEGLYKDKNYYNARVTYNINMLDNNQADLELIISEGDKIRIKHIEFVGNHAYTDQQLKKMMQTSEESFFSWLTSAGELNMEDLNQDIANLTAFYHNNGYVQARLSEPDIKFTKEWIKIKIKIEEGPQFKVGRVDIEGDLILPKEPLVKGLKISKENYFNVSVMRNDVLNLTDLYSDEGYFYADIIPRMDKDLDNLKVNVTFVIHKGKLVYFDKIIISGNTKTRDKVIRRELNVYEQELYSGKRLKRGLRNLYRLDYFEDIKVDNIKGKTNDKMSLKISVKEKPTGTFSFGGGYSSQDGPFGMVSVSQRNFMGKGQILQLKAELGGSGNSRYNLSFTEPWLFDIPLSAGFDLYNTSRDYDEYDKDTIGGSVRFGYPVYDFTRAYISYTYEQVDIYNISNDAISSIQELEGKNITSSSTFTVIYNTKNRPINPSRGVEVKGSVEYAGDLLGGDISFTKYIAEGGWYIPLFWKTYGFLHAKTGYVHDGPNGILPDYERFYLGGMNSIRGFDWRDIHEFERVVARDIDGNPILDANGNLTYENKAIGGDKFVQFNAEFLVPLVEQAGLVGVLFYDTGNVFKEGQNTELGDLHQSIGGGIRWFSPVGPIRIEYGYILNYDDWYKNELDVKDRYQFEFSMGNAF